MVLADEPFLTCAPSDSLEEKMRLCVLATVAFAMSWSGSAGAGPISSGAVINLTGSNTYNMASHVVNFINPVAIASDTLGLAPCVGCGSIAPATAGAFDYSIASSSFAPVSAVYNSLLVAANNGLTFSFDLATITNVIESSSSLAINGNGTMHLTGFDSTPGSFFFSTQGPNAPVVVSFSSTSLAAAVPEPGSFVLLVSAVLSLMLIVRRRRDVA